MCSLNLCRGDSVNLVFYLPFRLKAKGMELRQLLSTWLMLQRHWTGLQHVSSTLCGIFCSILSLLNVFSETMRINSVPIKQWSFFLWCLVFFISPWPLTSSLLSSADPTKFFGCELGAQTQFDSKNDRYIVNGSHEANKLQDMLDGFIKKFVLCTECENPETDLVNVTPHLNMCSLFILISHVLWFWSPNNLKYLYIPRRHGLF